MLRDIYIYTGYNIETKRISGERKEPIVFSSTEIGLDYYKVDTILMMKKIFDFVPLDNLYKQDLINKFMETNTWQSINSEEKEYIIELSASSNNDTDKVVHLLTSGIVSTQIEAVDLLKRKWVKNYTRNKKACSERINSDALNLVIAKYLSIEDSEDLQHTIRGLAIDYELKGVRGVVHNGDTYGLLDYFNSTSGTPYELQGIKDTKDYVMQNGDLDMTNFITDLLDVLLYGNY